MNELLKKMAEKYQVKFINEKKANRLFEESMNVDSIPGHAWGECIMNCEHSINNSHFYASDYLNGATAETREAAIKKLASSSIKNRDIKEEQEDGLPGRLIWTCEITGSADSYKIKKAMPVGITWKSERAHYITYLTKKRIAWFNLTDAPIYKSNFIDWF